MTNEYQEHYSPDGEYMQYQMENPPKERDTPKEAANELEEILAPVNELIRSVWSDELENLKDEKQAILSLIESEKVKAVEEYKNRLLITVRASKNIMGNDSTIRLGTLETLLLDYSIPDQLKELESKEEA